MKYLFAHIFILLFALTTFSGNRIDSLEQSFTNRDIDTSLVLDQLEVGESYRGSDSLKSLTLFQNALENAELLNYKKGKARAFDRIGSWHYSWTGDLEMMREYYGKALLIYRNLSDLQGEQQEILRMSSVFSYIGETALALEVLNSALESHPEEIAFQGTIHNAIGNLMKGMQQGESAVEHYDISEDYLNKLESLSDALILIRLSNDKNRGVIYRNNESYDTAYFYFDRSLQLSLEIQDSGWIARNYNSIGIMYEVKEEPEKAIEAFEKSLAIKRAINYTDGVITTLANLGSVYTSIEKYSIADAYLHEAEDLVTEHGLTKREELVKLKLSNFYAATGQHKLAYDYILDFYELKDSLTNEENNEIAKELEAKYKGEKNQILQEKLQAELDAADLREQRKSEQIKSQRNYIIIAVIIGLLMLILVIVVIRSNIRRRAINAELRNKNEEVLNQNRQIESQKLQIEEKNREMLDSITYAKRIQDAILPNLDLFSQQLPESFIYYQPKDILAGDFYWMEILDETVIWAAADCTGHGIPGAMVSVICHNALNRSVHEFQLKDPGEILDSTRKLVIDAFKKSKLNVKDGMDIAICAFNRKSNELRFAGANNPLWILRSKEREEPTEKDFITEEGNHFIKEIKGSKQPIGVHYDYQPFNSTLVKLMPGDILYTFTDGYADQFGGPKGKKLKYRSLKKILVDHAQMNLTEQGQKLNELFNLWKGDFEQIDDVCMIGVRL